MAKIRANSITINNARRALERNFEKDEFKVFWNEDILVVCVKDTADKLKYYVTKQVFEDLMPDVFLDIKLIPSNSDFWK